MAAVFNKMNNPGYEIGWDWEELILLFDVYLKDPLVKNEDLLNQLVLDLELLSLYFSRQKSFSHKTKEAVIVKLRELSMQSQQESNGEIKGSLLDIFRSDIYRFKVLAKCLRIFLHRNVNSDVYISKGGFALEGMSKELIHKRRERDYKIIKAKKQSVLAEKGKLECEVCEFNFQEIYGIRGGNYIEVHHTIPLSDYQHPRITFLEDLALLCSNCHRMIHRAEPWLTVEELRRIYKEGRAA